MGEHKNKIARPATLAIKSNRLDFGNPNWGKPANHHGFIYPMQALQFVHLKPG